MSPPKRPAFFSDLPFKAGCVGLTALVRLGLTVAGYNLTRRMVVSSAKDSAPPWRLRRAVWGVQAASRFVPGATCLTQALTAQILLSRQGFATEVRIGVRMAEQGLKAHAWLLSEGRPVLGATEQDLADFSPLVDLGPVSR